MKTTAIQQQLINHLEAGFLVSKKEQDNLFKILNGSNTELIDKLKELLNESEGISLSDEHSNQGKDWLLNLWKSLTGKERKNNPFGYREQEILTDFSHCELAGYYNGGNRYMNYYIPLYDVVSNDGSSFQYYMQGGEISIVG
jgi:hypothetical protein